MLGQLVWMQPRSAGVEEEEGDAVRTRVIVATSDMEERNAEYQSQSVVLWQNFQGRWRSKTPSIKSSTGAELMEATVWWSIANPTAILGQVAPTQPDAQQ